MAELPVVVGFDGSAAAHRALLWALEECHTRALPLLLVHVVDPVRVRVGPGPAQQSTGEIDQRLLLDGVDVAARARPDVDVATVLDHGDIADVLIERSAAAHLLVVGMGSDVPNATGLLGSTSHRVSAHALCPVALIPSPMSSPAGASPSSVAVGVASTTAGRLALQLAFEEAWQRDATLVCVRAWGHAQLEPDGRQLILAGSGEHTPGEFLLDDLAALRERYPDVMVEPVLVPGEPSDALLAAAQTAQLLIMGCFHSDEHWSTRLGPVPATTLSRATCPVILIGRRQNQRQPPR